MSSLKKGTFPTFRIVFSCTFSMNLHSSQPTVYKLSSNQTDCLISKTQNIVKSKIFPEMLGIQESVLHLFLLAHFLLLFSFLGLIFMFLLFLCLTSNQRYRREAAGWFGGSSRQVRRTEPAYFAAPPTRRGWFNRN